MVGVTAHRLQSVRMSQGYVDFIAGVPRVVAICLAVLFASLPSTAGALFPFVMPWDDASSGITNLSALNHKPAGQFGAIQTGVDGHLYAGGDRQRFFGVNYNAASGLPPKDQAALAAQRMARFGINAVRLHHIDFFHYPQGVFAANATGQGNNNTTRQLDARAMDQLDYFVAELKKQGIYINLSLLSGRKFTAADGLPTEIEATPWKLQHAAAIYHPGLITLQKEYAQALLTHRNAYTGLTYAEDPALAFVEINNEAGLFHAWQNGALARLPPALLDELRYHWNGWLAYRYGNDSALAASWNTVGEAAHTVTRNGDFNAGLASWTPEVFAPAVTDVTVAADPPTGVSGQALHLRVVQPGTAPWHVQIYQAGLTVPESQTYRLRFWARADRARSMAVALRQHHAPWQALGLDQAVALDGDWRAYEFMFRATGADVQARLEFAGLGLQAGAEITIAGVRLDAVVNSPGLHPGESLNESSIPLFTEVGPYRDRPASAQRDWVAFLREKEAAYYQDFEDYLKRSLGVRALVVGTQADFSTVNLMAGLDAVDTHGYWQHPVFPDGPAGEPHPTDWRVANKPMVNERGGVLPQLAFSRTLGLPHSVSEYSHPAPNTYVAEGHLLLAAYAALQDWDAIYAFSWGPLGDTGRPGMFQNHFDITQHPVKLATLIPAAQLFRRADEQPAREQVVFPLSYAAELELLRTNEFDNLAYRPVDASRARMPREVALVHRVAVANESEVVPFGSLLPDDVQGLQNQSLLNADNGQITWDASRPGQGVVSVKSRDSKAVIGFGAKRVFDLGDGFLLAPSASMQAGFSAITLTTQHTIQERRHMLITATGYSENTAMGWNADKSSVGDRWGQAPTLVEGIAALLRVPYRAGEVMAWALDPLGQRRRSLTIKTASDGTAQVILDPRWGTLWYELEIPR